MARALVAALSLALSWGAGAVPPADKDTLAMVEAFVKTPTEDLPPSMIERFVAVDRESLPKKLRRRFAAKRLELFTLRQLSDGKRKGSVRMPEADCSLPKDAKSRDIWVLKQAQFVEITEDEELYLLKRTKCTERDMMCEFTLQILDERVGRKKPPRRRYFLHPKDPLFALVAEFREGGRSRNTHFFGLGGLNCAK